MRKLLRLTIPPNLVNEPIIYKMITQYNLIPNILEARLDGDALGEVVIRLEGTPLDLERGILYLKELQIEVETLESQS
ncbi:MAG: NIL domain-containing protein [Leptospiraceae bacterium]|nr:NIL domain-containing protein [Leptospiraceae bacterium]MDW8306154.1 NIL domain-containing protein [Leptospiraceae bacterium]